MYTDFMEVGLVFGKTIYQCKTCLVKVFGKGIQLIKCGEAHNGSDGFVAYQEEDCNGSF